MRILNRRLLRRLTVRQARRSSWRFLAKVEERGVDDASGFLLFGWALAGRLMGKGGEVFEEFGGGALAGWALESFVQVGFESGDGRVEARVGGAWGVGTSAVAESLHLGSSSVYDDAGS